jgi:drug/metabolite transporter (DMT)-like permease
MAFVKKSDGVAKQVFWTRMPVVFLAAFFCCALWGSASPSIKIGYELFSIGADDTPARILFAGIRFTIAGLMVILYASIRSRHWLVPKRESWKYVAVLALTQTILQYIFFYMALAHTSGVRGSIINAAGTFFSIFLAVAVFHFEKLTIQKVLGSLLGFAGVVVIFTGGDASTMSGGFSFAGEGAMLLAAFISASAGCFIKLFSKHEDPVVLSGWQFFIGGIVMVLIGTIAGGKLHMTSSAAIVLILYMGFISAGAYTLWGILLKYNPVSRITILGFMNPVMGVILSAIFLREGGEALQWTTVLALVLVSLGIVVTNR